MSTTPLTLMSSFVNDSILISLGEASIKTLRQSLVIGIVVQSTIIQKTKVQMGSTITIPG